ncbi:WbqC family protein [Magnetofaba australis]|uniref:WbqC family protein n=1 Tax=Magnetofaba australis TaxID=1472297 RepID=UPI000A19F564|nr:WbqC family protein [Magnetofaba australis]
MTTLAVLQPGYLPWLGYFDQMRRADLFIHYDDVAFDKHGWRNRNRIKSPQGPQWLSVPVRHKGLGGQPIHRVRIDAAQGWPRKHLQTMAQLYARAPHTAAFLPHLQAILQQPWEFLADLDIALAERMAGWLGIATPTRRASALEIGGARSERLVNLCRHFGADRYLTGDSARNYLNVALFERAGIEVIWQNYAHPVYPQRFEPFVPYLSAVDLLFNLGPAAADCF